MISIYGICPNSSFYDVYRLWSNLIAHVSGVFLAKIWFLWLFRPNLVYKSYLYTKNAKKHTFFAHNLILYGVLSWIKGYKFHRKKDIDKCHIWISFIKFDPTSKFRKTWFLCFYVVCFLGFYVFLYLEVGSNFINDIHVWHLSISFFLWSL